MTISLFLIGRQPRYSRLYAIAHGLSFWSCFCQQFANCTKRRLKFCVWRRMWHISAHSGALWARRPHSNAASFDRRSSARLGQAKVWWKNSSFLRGKYNTDNTDVFLFHISIKIVWISLSFKVCSTDNQRSQSLMFLVCGDAKNLVFRWSEILCLYCKNASLS